MSDTASTHSNPAWPRFKTLKELLAECPDYEVPRVIERQSLRLILCKCGEPATHLQCQSFALPKPHEAWVFRCNTCDDNGEYAIEITRIGTIEKALDWMIHLLGKNWFAKTSTSWRIAIDTIFPERNKDA